MKKSVLITGNAGLIGASMANWIIKHKPEYEVVGVDNLFGGFEENIDKKVIFYKRELSTDSLDDIFEKHNIEYVFHFAAYAAEGLSPFMRKFNYMNNSVSTANVINHCIKYNVKRLIYTSSTSVYGHGDFGNKRFDETLQPNPIDPYGVSKFACEMDIKIAGTQHGLEWCIIRPHNIFGPLQDIWDKYRNVLGIWMYQILHNKPMLIYGDGNQTRAFSYIDDILGPLWMAATSKETVGEIINLGGITPYTINESAKILCDITGYDKIEYKEARHEVKWAVPTYQKSIDLLNYEDKTSLKDGLNKMWEWAKVQKDRPQYKWDNYEITNGIYTYWK